MGNEQIELTFKVTAKWNLTLEDFDIAKKEKT